MYIIGLTGNIATGKSTVGRMLADLGARYIDADVVAHEVMARDGAAFPGVVAAFGDGILDATGEIDRRKLGAIIDADVVAHEVMARDGAAFPGVVAAFGDGILDATGEIDRRKLGAIVFADAPRLRQLEEIVHPAVSARISETLAAAVEEVVVLDAIKLLESGLRSVCDAVWVVICPRQQQLDRLARTRGLSREEALLRIDAQPPQEDKARQADVVIDNGATLASTRRQVTAAWCSVRRQMAAKAGPPD